MADGLKGTQLLEAILVDCRIVSAGWTGNSRADVPGNSFNIRLDSGILVVFSAEGNGLIVTLYDEEDKPIIPGEPVRMKVGQTF